MPKSKKPFKKAYLEITSQCNLDCSFCPKTSRPPQFITVEQFDYLLGQVQPLTNFVYLHLMGEPLLHPQLDRLLELCAQRGLKVSLTTNGTLLHRWQQLLQSPALYRVSISLHSFEANRTGQSLEEYLSKALEFCRAASDLDRTYCVLRLWNKDSAVLKAENQRNVDIFEQVRRFFCLQEDPQKLLETKASIQLCRRVYLEMAEKFAWPDIERTDPTDSVFCYGLRDQFGVLVDGTVVPCCLDSDGNIPLGNVYQQPLAEILTSPRAQALHDGFSCRRPTEELCPGAAMPSVIPSANLPF